MRKEERKLEIEENEVKENKIVIQDGREVQGGNLNDENVEFEEEKIEIEVCEIGDIQKSRIEIMVDK